MSDQNRFLQNVVENPRDHAARLIYADWLVEHGDRHGELIQAQFELAGKCTAKRRQELRRRESALIDWLLQRDPIHELLRKPKFECGFIEEVTMATRSFITDGDQFCARHPLRRLVLTAGVKRIKDLVKCQHLRHIESLEFRASGFEDEDMVELASCPYLSNLRSLHMRSCNFSSDAAKAMADSDSFSSLESLRLTYSDRWNDRCVQALCESKKLSGIKSLMLEGTSITARTGNHVAQSMFRPNLERLDLSFTDFRSTGVINLMSSQEGYPRLSELLLNGCEIRGNRGIKELDVNSKRLPALSVLGLNFNNLGNSGAIALSKSVLLGQLLAVRMSQNGIESEGLESLGGSPQRNKKTKFYLAKNRIRGGQLSRLLRLHGDFGKFSA